jgi:flavin-dependent dehydrogenase
MTLYDVAIIGGGPAGAAAATLLARAGRSVVLLEKEGAQHDKVCGDFISHEGASYLKELGLSIDRLGSVPIRHVRLARHRSARSAPLPFTAQSLSRRVLDEALLERAVQAGVEVRRGSRVRSLAASGDSWAIEGDGAATARAGQVFLATGKHDLKDWKRPPGRQSDLIAFKMYLRLAPAQAEELSGHVELILFPGGYAGLQPVEGGRANLCLLVRKSDFAEKYASWENLLGGMQTSCPHLATRLAGAAYLLDRPLAISGLPYGHVARDSGGVWRLGDQAAVIPSFSGDGMSIALHSAHLAARFYLKGASADTFQRTLASQLAWQVGRATFLSRVLVNPNGQLAAQVATRFLRSNLTLGAALTRIPARAICAAGPVR